MSASTDKPRLRLITYLSPGVDIAVFDTILQYLETVLGAEAWLIRESRWSGPPQDRVDPFTANEVDLGFMCSSVFLRMKNEKNPNIELCPAAPVFQHNNGLGQPVYFSDVIINSDNVAKYNTFHDLKGCQWAYNEDISLSGSLIVLAELKRQGTNAAFFGNIIKTGSHLKSIQMVIDQTVDAAAIDSNVLKSFVKTHPERKDKIAVVTSLGPMPIYPLVFNSRMPAEMKEKITKALLEMNKSQEWNEKLQSLNISGFVPIDSSLYDMETEIKDLVKNMSINAAYY